jgi:hypothetical protein
MHGFASKPGPCKTSSYENTSYVNPQSKEEQNVKNTRPRIPDLKPPTT